MKKLLSLFMLFVVTALMTSSVSALDNSNLDWKEFELNGHHFDADEEFVLAVKEGGVLNVEVGVVADTGANDIEVDARISGFEYAHHEGKLYDVTELFNIQPGTTKFVDLELELPKKLEKDEYWLRLRIMQKNGPTLEKEVKLSIEPSRHGVDIADVVFSPGNSVKAGRSLLTTVLLENFGDKDEKDVKVSVAVPALGISATEFVDRVETSDHNVDYEDVPEMFLPIPANAAEGDYQVVVTVDFDSFSHVVTQTHMIHVTGNEMFQQSDKLVLAVGPEVQAVAQGTSATYGVALTNAGHRSQAYTIQVATGDWATASVSDNLVVLEPGKNQVVYVDVNAAENAPAGEHMVSVTINAGGEALETVTLRAAVTENDASGSSGTSLRNGLEIALIVLVVLLVIIGLIIGFSRLRKDEDEEEQTYY